MLPVVSFVVPCYNEVEYIGSCLASIRQQKIDPSTYEIIVVDNGSTDGTKELAASLGATVLLNSKRGAAASRNLGAQHAKGELLAFVDADCILDTMWLSKLSTHFLSESVSAVAAPAVPDIEGMTWVEKAWDKVFVRFTSNSLRDVVTVSNLASSNMLINKCCFKAVGGFDENLLSCEDYDLSQRLLKRGTLLLDLNIFVTHLRESKTIRELFCREIVRGRFSLRCFIKNGCALRELPSIILPFFNVTLFIALLILFFLKNIEIGFFVGIIYFLIPTIYLIRSGLRFENVKCIFQEYIVAITYVAARSFALIKEISDMSQLNFKH